MFLDFHWTVPDDGFEWAHGKVPVPGGTDEVGEFLSVLGSNTHYRTYKPDSALFRAFAEAEVSRKGVLDFANRYGSLGSREASVLIVKPNADGAYFYPVASERFERYEVWAREISSMAHVLNLWDALKRNDSAFLKQHIHWHRAKAEGVSCRAVGLSGQAEWFTVASPGYNAEIMALFAPGDLVLPARFALHALVNDHIARHGASPRLVMHATRKGMEHTLQLVPDNLNAALWLQLARAVEGDLDYRQCTECLKWVEVSGGKRADFRFCSDVCRFKAYRVRIKKAREMRAAGISLKDIAKELGSDVETVKGWTKCRVK